MDISIGNRQNPFEMPRFSGVGEGLSTTPKAEPMASLVIGNAPASLSGIHSDGIPAAELEKALDRSDPMGHLVNMAFAFAAPAMPNWEVNA